MISVTILVKNGQRHLKQVLEALSSFDEVVVLDTGSTDSTMEIAKSFSNVALHTSPFLGFGPSHNLASSLAKHDWIFSLDADEIASSPLVSEILSLDLKNTNNIYTISRHNFFRGKFIKGCGWYPDCPVRLYNRKITSFSDAMVHEAVLTTGMNKLALKNPVFHYPYNSISDFLAKMQSYSTLFAEQYKGKRSSSLAKAISHAGFAFFKSYVVKRGILLGQEGFIISLYNAHTAYYKYLKLQEINET